MNVEPNIGERISMRNSGLVLFLASLLMLSMNVVGVTAKPYQVMDGPVEDGGTIRGIITFNGTPPAPEMHEVDTDPEICGETAPSEELIVNGDGGISNAVVSILDIESGKEWNYPTDFVYDQRNCRFEPHVMIIKARTKGKITNSDNTVHNIHTISRGIYNINKSTSAHSEIMIKERKIRRPGVVRVKCDMHYWMKGWWIVAKNPYSVLTNEAGEFAIDDVPAGNYRISVWHEKLGESEYTVEVDSGSEVQLNVALDQAAD